MRLTALEAVASLALLGTLSGCSDSVPDSATEPSLAAVIPNGAQAESLEELPRPDLSAFAEPVQRQIERELSELEGLRAGDGTTAEEHAERYGRVGRVYHAYGLLEPAEAAYRNAAALDAWDPRWPYLLGVCALRRGDSELGERHLRRALSLAPENLPTMLRLAELLLQNDRRAEAGELFEEALARDPESAAARLGLARIASASGDHRAAIAGFERVLELAPEARNVHYLLGLAYQRIGDQDAAARHIAKRGVSGVTFEDPLIDGFSDLTSGLGLHLERAVRALGEDRYQDSAREYRSALEVDPENLTALRGLGLALAAGGRHAAAADAYREMLRIDPDHRLARMELGATLLEAGDLDGAAAQLEEAVRLDPDFRQAQYNLAVAHYRAGRLQEALTGFGEVLRIDPRDRLGLYQTGVTLDVLGRTREAAEVLGRTVELYPKLGLARQRLGDVLARLGDTEGAAEQFRAVLALEAPDQEKALARYQIGRMLALQGADRDALTEFREAVRLFPELLEARLGMGEAQLRLGRFSEAASEFERAVRAGGNAVHGHRRWAEALARAGRFAEARRVLEEGLSAAPRSAELAHDLARLLATAPDRSLRDGDRALMLAEGAFRADQSLVHGETIAMALAELGRFEEASGWQGRLIEQASAAGRAAELPRLRANLERYRRAEPVRRSAG